MLEDYPEILTIGEVADILRVTPLTLKRWEAKGKLVPIARINARGDRRYSKQQVLAFLGMETPQHNNKPETDPHFYSPS